MVRWVLIVLIHETRKSSRSDGKEKENDGFLSKTTSKLLENCYPFPQKACLIFYCLELSHLFIDQHSNEHSLFTKTKTEEKSKEKISK